MPSWNVHTAHVQRLLSEGAPLAFGIRDANAFLFGNFLPDLYVGYMVPDPTKVLDYRMTHVAAGASIPVPREREFWDTYVVPARPVPGDVPDRERAERILGSSGYRASDVTLGAWAHILCDSCYNAATRAWLAAHDVPTGEKTRIRKQDDFDRFGRTLPVSLTCDYTKAVVSQARDFPQYEVEPPDVKSAVILANGIVEVNLVEHLSVAPRYSLFTEDFFHNVFEHVSERLYERLRAYATSLAPGGEG